MEQKISKKVLLPCQPLMPTIDANDANNNLHLRLNMQITQLSASRLCDSRIYLHTTDQSQRIKQLQCIIIMFIIY